MFKFTVNTFILPTFLNYINYIETKEISQPQIVPQIVTTETKIVRTLCGYGAL